MAFIILSQTSAISPHSPHSRNMHLPFISKKKPSVFFPRGFCTCFSSGMPWSCTSYYLYGGLFFFIQMLFHQGSLPLTTMNRSPLAFLCCQHHTLYIYIYIHAHHLALLVIINVFCVFPSMVNYDSLPLNCKLHQTIPVL